MDDSEIYRQLTDDDVRNLILEISHCDTIAQFQHLPINRQRNIVAQAATYGAAINQLARITGLSYRQVYKTIKKKYPSE